LVFYFHNVSIVFDAFQNSLTIIWWAQRNKFFSRK
jgi:hypothetical protein